MAKIVTKFGGSSLADAKQFRKVKRIITSNHDRCYVIPSAPGKRTSDDRKITDLLYETYRIYQSGGDMQDTFRQIRERYISIADELALSVDINTVLDEVEQNIIDGASEDYVASRGEYLNGILLADYLCIPMLDPYECVFFREDGVFDSEKTNRVMGERLNDVPRAVIPGFYGQGADGKVKTFSRGGSDITGALVARACNADLYENWTDVSGFMMADPRIVKGAKAISAITYRELRELSYMGAAVLHEDSVFPVHIAGIPTNIRNTNLPDDPGTIISHDVENDQRSYVITGIAGKTGFSVLSIEKAMMNSECGFGRKVLQAVEEFNLSFEHMPTGIDTMCIVLSTASLTPVREALVARIMELTSPDTLTIHDHMGIIATVGRGMVHNPGTAARLFSALSREQVNVRMIDQGSSELSILVGVDDRDFNRAILAIYSEFVHN